MLTFRAFGVIKVPGTLVAERDKLKPYGGDPSRQVA